MLQSAIFNQAQIEFPVSFKLRVIMLPQESTQENQLIVQRILEELSISFADWDFKDSRKGKYLRVLVQINLQSRSQMEELYQKLEKENTIKLAI